MFQHYIGQDIHPEMVLKSPVSIKTCLFTCLQHMHKIDIYLTYTAVFHNKTLRKTIMQEISHGFGRLVNKFCLFHTTCTLQLY